jgi:toxin ParE1/3/4
VKHRLTKQAARDVSNILTNTYRMFGEFQFARYVRVLDAGVVMVAENPFRPTSKDRADIRPGVRSLHLQIAAGRKGGASHIIYFRLSESNVVVVARILGDEMEPKRRVAKALRDDER